MIGNDLTYFYSYLGNVIGYRPVFPFHDVFDCYFLFFFNEVGPKSFVNFICRVC